MTRPLARTLAGLGAAATLALGLAGVAAPASAAPAADESAAKYYCTVNWSDSVDEYHDSVKMKPGTPVKAGPYRQCNTRYTTRYFEFADADCWVRNNVGHIWWHVRAHHGATAGWVYEENLLYRHPGHKNNHC